MNTSNITNYKPSDFAKLLGVSVKTLQRWDREGILKAYRTPTDRRFYTYDQYLQFRGIIVDQCIEDYGSGLNYNRKRWNELLTQVMERKVKTIVVAHKDRFIRFGYDWFESFCERFDTSILVVNNEDLSPQEELVEDIVSILHVFSCRLHGLRKYKKLIKEDEDIAEELQDGTRPNK